MSGRSLSLGREEGLTKTLWDEETGRLIGAAIVGPSAGDLIAEAGLAIEMGCDAEDIGLAIHPHPTLSDTVAMSAESYAWTLTDLYIPRFLRFPKISFDRTILMDSEGVCWKTASSTTRNERTAFGL